MARIALLAFAALVLLGSLALAADPPGMACQNATVVRYHPALEWASFAKHKEGHLAFLRKEMERGTILFAGPLQEGETFTAGMAIYKGNDLKAVDAAVQGDPLVGNKVVTYEISGWMMCNAAPKK
jgi:uncharacterized protein YciI